MFSPKKTCTLMQLNRNPRELKMSSTIFSIKFSPLYLWITGNKILYAQVLTVAHSPSLVFWCLKFNFPVIVPTVGKYRELVKKNKSSSKFNIDSCSASHCTLITVFLSTIQHSISSRKLHQLYAMFFMLRFSSRVTVNSNV